MDTKTTTLRLPKSMADELAAIAKADGSSVSETVREGLERYIVSRRSERDFKARLKERLDADRELYERFIE